MSVKDTLAILESKKGSMGRDSKVFVAALAKIDDDRASKVEYLKVKAFKKEDEATKYADAAKTAGVEVTVKKSDKSETWYVRPKDDKRNEWEKMEDVNTRLILRRTKQMSTAVPSYKELEKPAKKD